VGMGGSDMFTNLRVCGSTPFLSLRGRNKELKKRE